MAAAKQAIKKGPVKTTAVAKWDEALAARARLSQKLASNLGTGGNWISLKGGVMKYKGNPVEGNAMDVVVPSFILENQFYGQDYDPDTPQSPVCYAFGDDQKTMRPHENSPQKQHETCKGCPQNEWGTADRGRGKACKNVARLALLPADCLDGGAQGVADAEEAFLKVPVTSCKAWGGYVSSLEAVNKPPLAFVTEVREVPDAKNQFALQFKAKEQIEDGELLGALLDRADVMDKTIAAPYPDFGEADKQAAGRHFKGANQKKGNGKAKAEAPPPRAATPAGRRAMVGAAPAQAAGGQKRRKF